MLGTQVLQACSQGSREKVGPCVGRTGAPSPCRPALHLAMNILSVAPDDGSVTVGPGQSTD